jgi:hypothetical protein
MSPLPARDAQDAECSIWPVPQEPIHIPAAEHNGGYARAMIMASNTGIDAGLHVYAFPDHVDNVRICRRQSAVLPGVKRQRACSGGTLDGQRPRLISDNAENLVVIGVASGVGYVVRDASGVIRRRDLALGKYLPAVRLNRQVNQETRIIRPAQADRGPVAIPVRYLNEILRPEIAPQAVNKRDQGRQLRHTVHDGESGRRHGAS